MSSRIPSGRFGSRTLRAFAIVAVSVATMAQPVIGQGPPPRQGTSSVGTNTDSFYRALGAVASATWAGLTRVYDAVTPGGPGPEAFSSLHKGSVVVVHYAKGSEAPLRSPNATSADDELPTSIEGTVQRIDRGRKEITVRFDSRTTETFQLVERAATEVGPDTGESQPIPDRVTIDYPNEAGQKVAHTFRRKS